MKRLMIASASAALAMGGSLALASPANAAGPLFTGGLVNVTITDTLNNNEILTRNNIAVGVAANIAANVCDVNVGGILGQLRDTGEATCNLTSDATDQLVITQTR